MLKTITQTYVSEDAELSLRLNFTRQMKMKTNTWDYFHMTFVCTYSSVKTEAQVSAMFLYSFI